MQTPALEQLLGAYFHQDWSLDGSEHEILEEFMDDEPDLAARLPTEVGWLTEVAETEEELGKLLWERGSYYRADPASGGYRGFLERIAERARQRG